MKCTLLHSDGIKRFSKQVFQKQFLLKNLNCLKMYKLIQENKDLQIATPVVNKQTNGVQLLIRWQTKRNAKIERDKE